MRRTARRWTTPALVIATLCLVPVLASCSEQLGDRPMTDDVVVRDLDAVTVYRNIDEFPNIARACADGVAFAVSSSENGPSMVRVPEWDEACP